MSTKERKNITAQELYYLLKRNSEGDIEARNRLAELYIDLSFRVSKERFIKNPTVDEQEIVSASFLGLMRGIDTYNIDSNLGYTEYLTKNIAMSIDAAIKENSKTVKDLSLTTLEQFESIMSDGKDDMCSIVNKKESISALKKFAKELKPMERAILELYFGFVGSKEMTIKEIAKETGYTEEEINERIVKGLGKLKTKLVKYSEEKQSNKKTK